jgi:hypothetical protein
LFPSILTEAEKQSASQKGPDKNIMKKITSVLLGLSLTLATAGLSLAAQTAAPATGSTPAPVAKKHVKKNKKANKTAASTSSTPAPAAAK